MRAFSPCTRGRNRPWRSAPSAEKPIIYPVESTGLWGEAVRQRRPVITNDYAAANPLKKGYPQGHVNLKRHMNVPVFDGARIVIVAGVGNKAEEYDQRDVQQLTLMMEGMWRLIERKQAEEKIRESEARYRNLFENAQDGIALADAETGQLIDCNQALCRMVERDKAELVGQPQSILHPLDDRLKGMSASFREHRTIDPNHALEDRLITRNSRLIPVEIRAANIQLNGNDYLLGIFRDITERKQMENAIRESEEKYRTLIENANEAVIVAQEGRLKYVNPRAMQLTGYSYEELTSPPFGGFIHPDDKEMIMERYSQRLEDQTPIGSYQFRVVHKNGDIRWADLNTVMITWEGKPATLNFLTDITERKTAEEALNQNEVKYRTLFDSAQDSIFLIEKDIFVDCNVGTLKMFACAKEQIIGKRPSTFSPKLQPDGLDSEAKAREFIKLAYQGKPQFFEWRDV